MKTVAFFEIPALQFERAVNFYEKVLNVTLTARDFGTEKMAFFPEEEGTCPGAISQSEGFLPCSSGILLSFTVKDMEGALTQILQQGGKIVRSRTRIEAEGKGYFSIFTDTEGNQVGLYLDQ